MELKETVSLIREVLSNRVDIRDLSVTIDQNGIDFYYDGGPLMLEDKCIFDACCQAIKTELLRFYFSENFHDAHFNWDINIEFAKLSAKFGTLVEKEAETFMPSSLSEQWTKYFLHVAYYGSSAKYEGRLLHLMDISQEDAREGLFIACWYSQSITVQRALAVAFQRWIKNGELDAGTGEIAALKAFLRKWKGLIDTSVLRQFDDFLRPYDYGFGNKWD